MQLSLPVLDITLKSDQSVHLVKLMPALEKVTLKISKKYQVYNFSERYFYKLHVIAWTVYSYVRREGQRYGLRFLLVHYLRILASYEAKIAKKLQILDILTVIQLINHLFKI